MPYFFWFLVSSSFLQGVYTLFRSEAFRGLISRTREELKSLDKIQFDLRDLRSKLESGISVQSEEFEVFSTSVPPFSYLLCETLSRLRSRGAALTPTLERIEKMTVQVRDRLHTAESQTASVRGQFMFSLAMGPLLSVTLWFLVDAVRLYPIRWIELSLVGWTWSLIGVEAVFRQISGARAAGLCVRHKDWPVWLIATSEKLATWVRTGEPPDLAWNQCAEFLGRHDRELSKFWGTFTWQAPTDQTEIKSGIGDGNDGDPMQGFRMPVPEASIPEWITRFRRDMVAAIQISAFEGRPCTQRIEGILTSLQQEWAHQIQVRVSNLSSKALVPLFVFMAPALMSLLIGALYFSWISA